MKNCIITDLHGESPLEVIEKEKDLVDRFIFLGDYGVPNIIQEITENLPKEKRKILIGNYEYIHTAGKSFSHDNSNFPDYWDRYPHEKELVLNMVSRQEFSHFEKTDIGNILYLHGALVRNEGGHKPPEIWAHIEKEWGANQNFNKMRGRDIKIMFRGHSHEPSIRSREDSKEVRYIPQQINAPFQFRKDTRYIVTVGAFCDKKRTYGLFDDEKGIFTECCLFDGI